MLSIRVPSPSVPAVREPHFLFSPGHASPTFVSFSDSLNSPSIPRAVRNSLLDVPEKSAITYASNPLSPFAGLSPVNSPLDVNPSSRFSPPKSNPFNLALKNLGKGNNRRYGGSPAVHKHPNVLPSFRVNGGNGKVEEEEVLSESRTPRGAGSLDRTPVQTPRTARPT